MSGGTFLDTNVLVYLFDAGEPAKQAVAREIIAAADPAFLVISAQVLGEFYVTVTRKLSRALDPELAAQAVADLSALTVVSTDLTTIVDAIRTSRESRLSYWDALIIEAAATSRCGTILTEDLADGSIIRGVRIVNPFGSLDPRG